jgi:hypothetical protein
MIGYDPIGYSPIGDSPGTAGGGAGDSTVPTFTGSISESHTSDSVTVNWSNSISADNVAVARREYRIGGVGAYTAATSGEEASETHTFAGLSASTTYQIDVRCVDTSGNVSTPLSIGVTTSAASGGGGEFNHVLYTLVTHDRAQHVDLVNLKYALFAQLSPALFTAPVAKGTIASIVGPALLDIPVLASAVPVGWYMLVLSDADNTTTVAVPVLVS